MGLVGVASRRWAGLGPRAVALALALSLSATGVASQEAPPSEQAAFGVEAAGGLVGSLAGLGLGVAIARPDDCGEDLSCTLSGVALAVGLSAAGAAAGDYVAGHLFRTRPSAPGAVVGALVGTAAAAGFLKLLDETTSGGADGAGAVIAFSVTQSLFTAAGSRAWRALFGP